MKKIIPCNGDCFNCQFPDCIGAPPEEYKRILNGRAYRQRRYAKKKCRDRLSAILDRDKGKVRC